MKICINYTLSVDSTLDTLTVYANVLSDFLTAEAKKYLGLLAWELNSILNVISLVKKI